MKTVIVLGLALAVILMFTASCIALLRAKPRKGPYKRRPKELQAIALCPYLQVMAPVICDISLADSQWSALVTNGEGIRWTFISRHLGKPTKPWNYDPAWFYIDPETGDRLDKAPPSIQEYLNTHRDEHIQQLETI